MHRKQLQCRKPQGNFPASTYVEKRLQVSKNFCHKKPWQRHKTKMPAHKKWVELTSLGKIYKAPNAWNVAGKAEIRGFCTWQMGRKSMFLRFGD